jgi:hypothetical protein
MKSISVTGLPAEKSNEEILSVLKAGCADTILELRREARATIGLILYEPAAPIVLRSAKYNQLLRIEEELGNRASFANFANFRPHFIKGDT